MRGLIEKWRAEAVKLEVRSPASTACARIVQTHANELEQAWHDYAHDGEFEPGCLICDKEREQYA